MKTDDCIFNVPIDFFYRDLTDQQISNVSTKRKLKLRNIVSSCLQLIKLRRYRKYIFIPDRLELMTKAELIRGENGVIVLSIESGNKNLPDDYIDGALFDILRGILRLSFSIVCVVFLFRYIAKKRYGLNLWVYLKVCNKIVSDTVYNYTLKLFFDGDVYYSIATIPGVEKFQNLHGSTEIQHGVIHRKHNGFIGLPMVKNTLLVDSEFYKKFLYRNGYNGKIEVNIALERFSRNSEKPENSRKIVAVFTQPGGVYFDLFYSLISYLEKRGVEFVIRKHPLDQTRYPTSRDQNIGLENALESEIGICSTSTIVESFIKAKRMVIMIKPAHLSEEVWQTFTDHYQDFAAYNGSTIICCSNVQDLENVIFF